MHPVMGNCIGKKANDEAFGYHLPTSNGLVRLYLVVNFHQAL